MSFLNMKHIATLLLICAIVMALVYVVDLLTLLDTHSGAILDAMRWFNYQISLQGRYYEIIPAIGLISLYMVYLNINEDVKSKWYRVYCAVAILFFVLNGTIFVFELTYPHGPMEYSIVEATLLLAHLPFIYILPLMLINQGKENESESDNRSPAE